MPEITGRVDRRILLDYRVEPEVAATLVPEPFRPRLVDGHAHTGVFIRRRDTASRLTALVGGRLFPGYHHEEPWHAAALDVRTAHAAFYEPSRVRRSTARLSCGASDHAGGRVRR